MYIYRGENPKLILLFDTIIHKNFDILYQYPDRYNIEKVYTMLKSNFKEYFKDLILKPEELVIAILFSPKEAQKKESYLLKKIDKSLKYDLVAEILPELLNSIPVLAYGKFSLYSLTNLKQIMSFIGQEKTILIRLDNLPEIRSTAVPNYSLSYLVYNPAVIIDFLNVNKRVFYKIAGKEDDLRLKIPETATLKTKEDVELFYNKIKQKNERDFIIFDLETQGLHNCEILGFSFDFVGNDIPVYVENNAHTINTVKKILKEYKLVGHNIVFDLRQIVYNNILTFEELQVYSDTLVMAHLVYNNLLNTLKLKSLCKKLFNAPDWEKEIDNYAFISYDKFSRLYNKHFKDLVPEILPESKEIYKEFDNTKDGVNKLKELLKSYRNNENKKKLKVSNINAFIKELKKEILTPKEYGYHIIPSEILSKYASLDAYFTKLLFLHLEEKWKDKYNFLLQNYNEFIKLVSKWTMQGIKIDIEQLNKLISFISQKISEIQYKIYSLPEVSQYIKDNGEFNLDSYDQVSTLLKNYFNVKVHKKTKSGNISTDEEGINYILDHYTEYKNLQDFLNLFLEYKEYEKAMKSYGKKISEELVDDLFYPDFNICGTITGRLSSFFHTIPSRSELGEKIKRIIIPRNKDFVIFSVDFKTLEPRVLASLSGDEKLISVFNEGKDIYKYIASKVFNVSYNEVTKSQRNQMKQLVLAIMYGMSSKSLARALNISKEEAENIIQSFYTEFNKVYEWQQEVFFKTKRTRVIETPLGREIPVVVYDDNSLRRKTANYPIQSTASEVANICFYTLEKVIKSLNMKSFSIGGVHDSIILEVHISEILKMLRILQSFPEFISNKFPFLKAKLELETSIGLSWGSAKLELISLDKKSIILSGNSIDFLPFLHKLYDYNILINMEVLSKEKLSDTTYNLVLKLTLKN